MITASRTALGSSYKKRPLSPSLEEIAVTVAKKQKEGEQSRSPSLTPLPDGPELPELETLPGGTHISAGGQAAAGSDKEEAEIKVEDTITEGQGDQSKMSSDDEEEFVFGDDSDDGFGQDDEDIDCELLPSLIVHGSGEADCVVDSTSEPDAFDVMSPGVEGELH